MIITPPSARVAFVVHLEGPESTSADVARIQHVIHLFRGLHLPATWSIASFQSIERMHNQGLLNKSDELALAISPAEAASHKFRDSLRGRLAAIQSCTGITIGLLAGEASAFCSHAAFLREQHLRGVLSNTERRPKTPTNIPLPCGLWQLHHALAIPRTSWFSRIMPNGGTLHELNKLVAGEETILISVDALKVAHTSARHLQNLERLLREVSHSASRDCLSLTTAGEIVSLVSAQRAPRPQHSILRPLAA